MGYCNQRDVLFILNQALTTATNNQEDASDDSVVPLYEISNSTRPNAISPETVDQYILWSDEEIDAALSEMYAVPFSEKVDLELRLLSDIDVYNDVIDLDKAGNLHPGDTIIFVNEGLKERHIVDSIDNITEVSVASPLIGFYDAMTTRVLRVKYPPAISLISTRLTAANLFDKYFTAQVSPGISDYGKNLRRLARRDLNNILHGRTILHGQDRIGHRFLNSNIRDRYRLPGVESDASRDIGEVE